MKKIQMIAGLIPVMGLLLASCSREYEAGGEKPAPDDLVALTFNMTTPAGDKVIYKGTRAPIHDAPEYTINSLTLYEYTSDPSGSTTKFVRELSYPNGGLDLTGSGPDSYTFTLKYPSTETGKTYIYKFVANDKPATPAVDASFNTFKTSQAAITLDDQSHGTTLAPADTGIAMSGTAVDMGNGGSEVITLSRNLNCKVDMTRIVARIDVINTAQNLRITSMEVQKAAVNGYLFPDNSPKAPNQTVATLKTDPAIQLPTTLPKELPDDGSEKKIEYPKAFYLYERANTSVDDSAIVYIEYDIVTPEKTWKSTVEIPFQNTKQDNQDFVNTERNHLYKIVLGNGTDVPTAGQVTFNIVVDEWETVDMEEEIG